MDGSEEGGRPRDWCVYRARKDAFLRAPSPNPPLPSHLCSHAMATAAHPSSSRTTVEESGSNGAHHITALIAASHPSPFFSLEFFPPKTEQGLANLYSRMARMIGEVRPAWVQVTWGAGGTTQRTSLDLAGRVQRGRLHAEGPLADRLGLPVEAPQQRDACLHLTCTNVERTSLDQTLDVSELRQGHARLVFAHSPPSQEALRLGIRNILALRGDPPRGQEYWVAADDRFQHATDLVRYIRERHGRAFCIGVAGYPESHPDARDGDDEQAHLLAKQESGADFIVTQLFYDVDVFLSWYRRCRERGITLPILPGIMPIQNYQSFRRMTTLCKTSVPQDVWDRLEPHRNDDAAVKEFGIEHAWHLITQIQRESDIRGFHICTLNLENSVKRLLVKLGWVDGEGVGQVAATALHNSSAAVQKPTMWDEFPNGRYGDARSPAFGEMDGYGVSLKVPPASALKMWGYPTSDNDISAIFVRYLSGSLTGIPWCDCPILNETNSIQEQLLALNRRGWWTVGSQPSVDGVESTDPTFGFGPRLGYIFQKAFVEFFITEQDMIQLETRIQEANESGGPLLSYFAGNRRGDMRGNISGQSCAVTWGCFVGKEIVQSTIIEEESFKAWRDEAFAIWSEWELLFPRTSPTHKLLHSIGEQRWLVTVIHHDYKSENALWDFLLPRE